LAISDRVAVLRNGDVIQYDEVETLYRAPHNRFVASFVGEANFFAAPDAGGAEHRTLVLRPEQLVLIGPEESAERTVPPGRASSTATGDRVVLDAVIETHQFLGATHRYACRHADGRVIVTDQRRFRVGTAVQIAYESGSGYLLPDEDTRAAAGTEGTPSAQRTGEAPGGTT
jgi:ABC-type Fe3+/spermidine/putrescine transport system ATPase subunit